MPDRQCADLEQAHPAKACALAAREQQMIEQGRVDCLDRDRQTAGGIAVRVAWRGVAARLVVRDDQPFAVAPRRFEQD